MVCVAAAHVPAVLKDKDELPKKVARYKSKEYESFVLPPPRKKGYEKRPDPVFHRSGLL